MKRLLLPLSLTLGLAACGDGNPFTADDAAGGGDTSTANANFLFDASKNLVMNQFTFDPTGNGGTGTIRINNIPFDGVSSQGGFYTNTGVVLPNGAEVFDNTPAGQEHQYYAVILRSPTGTGALVGAIGTDEWADFGFGGAYAERPSSGLPPSRTAAYRYDGEYAGVRVLRRVAAGGVDDLQLVTGQVGLDVDLQDLDAGGSIVGRITGRQVFDENGNPLGALSDLRLFLSTIDTTTNSVEGATADTFNAADGSTAQTGTWDGYFSGPGGEEIVGYVVVEGTLPDNDPFQTGTDTTGREVGGFLGELQP